MLARRGLGHVVAERKELAGDYVTVADRASEDAILEVLARRAPGIAVLAEERGGAASGTRWAVDPLDGTTNFLRGLPVLLGALERFEDLRRAGAAALDLAWTAAGTFDGFFELGLGTWDVAAGAALVLELGGRVSDWTGGPGWLETGDIVAAAPAVHEVLLELAAG